MMMGRWRVVVLVTCGLVVGCQGRSGLALPDGEEVESYYEYPAGLEAELVGNVAVITVTQAAQQLRRGGSLWAKVGPYIFLFTAETYQLFEDFPGLAAVRVITEVGTTEVANALLPRDELSDLLWRRSINISGRARKDGTNRMTLLEALVRWGEEHTQYSYNERYTRR